MKTTQYIWKSKHWPNFYWNNDLLISILSECRLLQGQLLQKISSLGFPLEQQAQTEILLDEAITTSSIEGENLSRDSVRSSISRKLGLPSAGLSENRNVDGLVEVLLDATKNYSVTLSIKRLYSWHAALFPTGHSGMQKIRVAKWRGAEPMRVVSIKKGRTIIHYEAPPYNIIDDEMKCFLHWWQKGFGKIEGLIRAAVAHFYFVTLHPFEDGNGRIARALTDMALAQDDKQLMRYYSLSSQILLEREDYYRILEHSQKGNLDLTEWLIWFLSCHSRAIRLSEKKLTIVLDKASFWYRQVHTNLSERQKKVVNKLLDVGRNGFIGGLTNRKYSSITGTSRATASRELRELTERGVIKQNPGKGRNVSYNLIWD